MTVQLSAGQAERLYRIEHFPEKWAPVFRQKMRPTRIYRLVVPLGAAAVPCISVVGLTQQARTRSGMLSAAFGSGLPCRMAQRNAAGMAPVRPPPRPALSGWRTAGTSTARQ